MLVQAISSAWQLDQQVERKVNPMQFAARSHKEISNTDRRGSDRFPMEREVKFRVLARKNAEEAGVGKTVNMSSGGVLFMTDQMLLPGRRLEIAISWPAQLNNTCPLKLVARGRVVRVDNGRTAVEIQQYEFRTQGKAAVQ